MAIYRPLPVVCSSMSVHSRLPELRYSLDLFVLIPQNGCSNPTQITVASPAQVKSVNTQINFLLSILQNLPKIKHGLVDGPVYLIATLAAPPFDMALINSSIVSALPGLPINLQGFIDLFHLEQYSRVSAQSFLSNITREPLGGRSGGFGGDAAPIPSSDVGGQLVDIDSDTGDEEDDTFERNQWIGVGRLWSDSLPRVVHQARNADRRLPDTVLRRLIPDSTLSPHACIAAFPVLSPTLLSAQAPVYVDAPPNTLVGDPSTSEFFDSLINIRPFLLAVITHEQALRIHFNDAWISGARSIVLPDAPDNRYPLWTEKLLGDMSIATRKHARWLEADMWLREVEANPLDARASGLLERCRSRLSAIPWDAVVPGLSRAVVLTTSHLAAFLSNSWLNDEMINAGSDFIMRQLGPHSRVRIANCFLLDSLRNLRARLGDSDYPSYQDSSLDRAIQAGRVDILEVIVHVNGNHWAGISLDIKSRTFFYRDGYNINATASAQDLELLQWYLYGVQLLPTKEAFSPASVFMHSPRQHDAHSCGVNLLSTIAQDHLAGYPEWTQASHASERIEWFLRLSQNLVVESEEHLSDNGNSSAQSMGMELDDIDLSASFEPTESPPPGDAGPSVPPTNHDRAPKRPELPPKRQIPVPSSDGSSDEGGSNSDSTSSFRSHRRHRMAPRGKKAKSDSWAHQKALNASAASAGFEANSSSLKSFRKKVLDDDPHAEFKEDDIRAVWCSCCTEWLRMRCPYDLRRWKEHRATAKCTRKQSEGMHTKSLFNWFVPKGAILPLTPYTVSPCRGLRSDTFPLIERYLRRTSTAGGGAPSRHNIALELFGGAGVLVADLRWSRLTLDQQRMVLRREQIVYKWRNERGVGAVFSSTCEGRGRSKFSSTSKNGDLPCDQCNSLWTLHTFQVVINRKMPDEENWKHTPVGYRGAELGDIYLKYKGVRELMESDDGRSPWLRFAKGAAEGLFESQEVVLGLVKAIVEKAERVRDGKSLKNMHYTDALDTFCSMLQCISPRSYKIFRHALAGRSISSIRTRRSHTPKFQAGISRTNIQRVAERLMLLDYRGPIALSWDDTDLEKALSVWQSAKSQWTVVGATQGVFTVKSLDEVDLLFENLQLDRAEKLRIFVVTIPLPRIPPILLAAVARGSKDSAETLYRLQTQLLEILHEVGIHIISSAADGTETERKLQRIISDSAHTIVPFSIANESAACILKFEIPCYHGIPCIQVQDSKHAAKTARNQLLSGAKNLAMGNFPMHVLMVHDFADHPLGPLFRRDVDRVDKQDDRAAARLLSAEALDFNLRFHPEYTSLSVYLFIMGELVDAWQNRNISHVERAKMAMRTRFTLMAWRTHVVQHPDYRTDVQFISRESFDIFVTLCDSLIELIIAYRKFYPSYPFLPWLHSTEVCEHIFGILRQLKADFTYADMLYLEPKLSVLLMGAFQNLSPQEQVNEVAEGYHHTYFNVRGLDLAKLMIWPSDEELATASNEAVRDVQLLLATVGINALEMLKLYKAPVPTNPWVPSSQTKPRRPQTLAEILALFSSAGVSLPTRAEDEVETCQAALIADAVDKTMTIIALPESSHADEAAIKDSIAGSLPENVNADANLSSSSLPLADVHAHVLSRDRLVSLRSAHQPVYASRAVRQANRHMQPAAPSTEQSSVRDALLRRLTKFIPVTTPIGSQITAGVNRMIRQTGVYAVANVSAEATRAEQKRTLNGVAASTFMRHRQDAFVGLQDVHDNMQIANITEIWPLRVGNFVLVLRPATKKEKPEILLGEVLAMYTNSGARGAKHDWISSISSVGAPSYINVQVFRLSYGSTYTSLSCSTLGCSTFLRIPRTHILFSLATAISLRKTGCSSDPAYPVSVVALDPFSEGIINILKDRVQAVSDAVAEVIRSSRKPRQALRNGDAEVESHRAADETDSDEEHDIAPLI
ncbi:hypothetical protein BV25DRAFT_1876116 [Artomyces pyxidatus]|uniref:Uncharacterized protein n=1 Tax=Artomyces pyxidatus TaxID=48021 RepID=A0ACB8TGL1_9AGAM|nr:hypothetical protein BV25DRAFT_1876116 [Artomyces pyxidatus]